MDREKQVAQLERMFDFGIVSKAILTERIEIIEEQFPDFDTTGYRLMLEDYQVIEEKDRVLRYA